MEAILNLANDSVNIHCHDNFKCYTRLYLGRRSASWWERLHVSWFTENFSEINCTETKKKNYFNKLSHASVPWFENYFFKQYAIICGKKEK
jgi:hypothetical protein